MNTTSPLQQSPYWERRYKLFTRFDDGIQMDLESLYSVTPETIALEQAVLVQGESVLDLFCGIGGNSIAFARCGKSVIAVDRDPVKIKMAKHNGSIYEVRSHITFINQAAEQFLYSLDFSSIDTVFLDPPWGGPTYNQKTLFTVNDFAVDLHSILQFAFKKQKEVLIKVPKQFEILSLQSYRRKYRIIPHFMNDQIVFLSIHFYV